MRQALRTEWLKLRRSRVPWVATAAMWVTAALFPAAIAAGVRGGNLAGGGLAAAKIAALASLDTAVERVDLAAQMLGVLVLLAGGFVAAWVCGREFAEGTVGGLFALPVRRGTIAVAKLTLVGAWTGGGAAVATGLAVGVAAVGGGFDAQAADHALRLAVACMATAALVLPFGWVASVTRGYLPAVAVLVGIVVVTQLAGVLGAGTWFPWSVPTLWTGAAGPEVAAAIGPWQWATVPAVGLAAVGATAWHWERMTVA